MAIVKLSAAVIAELNLEVNPSRSKYPWYTTEVGEGFFVPRTDLSREDYRPSVPSKLKAQGQKWTSSRVTLPKTNQPGVILQRLA